MTAVYNAEKSMVASDTPNRLREGHDCNPLAREMARMGAGDGRRTTVTAAHKGQISLRCRLLVLFSCHDFIMIILLF